MNNENFKKALEYIENCSEFVSKYKLSVEREALDDLRGTYFLLLIAK
jgi:hypothetical protein